MRGRWALKGQFSKGGERRARAKAERRSALGSGRAVARSGFQEPTAAISAGPHILLVARKWPWWGCLCHRSRQVLPVRFPPHPRERLPAHLPATPHAPATAPCVHAEAALQRLLIQGSDVKLAWKLGTGTRHLFPGVPSGPLPAHTGFLLPCCTLESQQRLGMRPPDPWYHSRARLWRRHLPSDPSTLHRNTTIHRGQGRRS